MHPRKKHQRPPQQHHQHSQSAQSLQPPPPPPPPYSGILSAQGEPSLRGSVVPRHVCPPPPPPVFILQGPPLLPHESAPVDFNASLLGVQMSLQVLSPLPSPRCTPSGHRLESHQPQHQDLAATSSTSDSESRNPPSQRTETTYFPLAAQARKVRFRQPQPTTTSTNGSDPTPHSVEDGEGEGKPSGPRIQTTAVGEAVEEKLVVDKTNGDTPAESIAVPPPPPSPPPPPPSPPFPNTSNDSTKRSAQSIASGRPRGNQIPSRLVFQSLRRKSPTLVGINIKVDPADCPNDIIVATATTSTNSSEHEPHPIVNVARKINILQRQNTVEDKGSASKSNPDRLRRISLRPSLNVLSALRGGSSQRSTDESSSTTQILPNGFIKTDSANENPAPPQGRRMTRFSTLLRASIDITGDGDSEAGLVTSSILRAGANRSNGTAFLLQVLCCCCYCCSCIRDGYFRSGHGSGLDPSSGGRRSHRDGSASGSERRSDYSNLIENHRLARLVTLLAVLAILGLVLTYIIKSLVEQQQPTIPPPPPPLIGRNATNQ